MTGTLQARERLVAKHTERLQADKQQVTYAACLEALVKVSVCIAVWLLGEKKKP